MASAARLSTRDERRIEPERVKNRRFITRIAQPRRSSGRPKAPPLIGNSVRCDRNPITPKGGYDGYKEKVREKGRLEKEDYAYRGWGRQGEGEEGDEEEIGRGLQP
jgi:hypothetical protein